MDLFEDEEILKPKKKKKIKSTTLILIAIVILVILCIITIVAIVYLKGQILTIKLDGKTADQLEDILIFEENDKIYIPIKKMAQYLGYDAFNGDYITRSEDDTNKCYIESQEELISFMLNSNILTKVINGQVQQIKIAEPVKEINGELCISSEGAQNAFNFKFYYDKNKINIETLSYLYSWYSQYAVNNGYLPIEETYTNKLAVLDNMLIVKDKNNYYGVISTNNGEALFEAKYDSIEYFPSSSEFLVGSNSKKGIISKDRTTKIQPIYDSIEKVTNKNDIFYIVKEGDLYGLLDENGKTILYPEYEKIGIDVSAYKQNGVTNGYILYNKLIPAKKENKWALIDINGNHVTEAIYDSFGCPKANIARSYGVITVPDYNLIVVSKNGKYNLITLEGKNLFDGYILDSVYITISEGKNIYYITYGKVTKELASFLQENGIPKPTPIQ